MRRLPGNTRRFDRDNGWQIISHPEQIEWRVDLTEAPRARLVFTPLTENRYFLYIETATNRLALYLSRDQAEVLAWSAALSFPDAYRKTPRLFRARGA